MLREIRAAFVVQSKYETHVYIVTDKIFHCPSNLLLQDLVKMHTN